MLNEWLKVAAVKAAQEKEEGEMVQLMMKLPVDDLRKLASGTSIKEAFGDVCVKAGEGDAWLTQFKGSPLFEQAMQLAQEELQLDALDLQRRQQDREMMQQSNQLWDARDRMRIQRRLLELELAREMMGAPAPEAVESATPPAPPKDPNAPPPVSVNVKSTGGLPEQTPTEPKVAAPIGTPLQHLAGGAIGGGLFGAMAAPAAAMSIEMAPKQPDEGRVSTFIREHPYVTAIGGGAALGALSNTPNAIRAYRDKEKAFEHVMGIIRNAGKTASARTELADALGRALAHENSEKAAMVSLLAEAGHLAAEALTKTALPSLSALTSGLSGMAGKVAPALKGLGSSVGTFAKNNPLAAAGIGIGAVGGAAAGAREGGVGGALRGAVGGGAMGGAAGMAAGGVSSRMATGQGLGTALGNTAMSGVQRGVGWLNNAKL